LHLDSSLVFYMQVSYKNLFLVVRYLVLVTV
jgi:hypothetical protein